jgi:spermidine synthase
MRAMGWLEALLFGMERFSQDTEGEVVYFGDGIGGFTTVLKTKLDILGNEGYALYCSGKPEASSKLDMDTQTLSAHVPMLFHGNPERVLVIGLASGVTAGEVLHYPVEQLEVIDINSLVVEASHFFRPWNNHVLSHPKTKLIVQDARAHMELSNTTYDVISSEPSNPWMAGLAALFTKDFFSLAKSRLKDEGIFVQFIHTYQMDWPTFSLVGRTFAEVFPESLLMRTNPSSFGPDFLLVGFKGGGGLKERIGAIQLRYARQSSNVVLDNHRVLYRLIVSEDLQRLFGDGPIHTDARPWLEFSAPKLLHTHDPAIAKQLDSRSWLSEETLNIIRQDAENVDFQIAYAEFALSLLRPEMAFQNPVDLSRASPDQKKRFFYIVKNFCKNNIVTDYSFFGDHELKKACISNQIEAAEQRLQRGQDTSPLQLHLGALYGELGLTEAALRNFAEAEQRNPANAHVHYNQAVFFSKLGQTEEAIHHYSETLRLDPYYINASNNLAWILATHGNPMFRNGHKAVQLSEYACRLDGRKDPYLLDTLAAAYAEIGRFKKAQLTALEAIDRAQLIGVEQLVREIQRRLILYQSEHPYHKKVGIHSRY